MEKENEVVTPESEPETPTEPTGEEPVESVEELKTRLESEKAEAIRQVTARAKQAEADKKVLEAKLNATNKGGKTLDVEDYIDISASLEGLDQREKTYLAEQHKLTGKSLSEIRKDENFLLWQSAYRIKVEKERTLAPSSTQPEEPKVLSFAEKLKAAKSIQEKEELLKAAGMMPIRRRHPEAGKIPLSR